MLDYYFKCSEMFSLERKDVYNNDVVERSVVYFDIQ